MTTYPLQDGMTLVLSVDDGEWQTVTFSSPGFADVTAATAGEIAKVLKKSGVGASVDADGLVVIQSTTIGEGSSLEVDTLRSTAALALGLGGAVRRATGTGPKAARVESEVGPFAMPRGERDFATFVDTWIDLKRRDGTIDELYHFWILGRDSKAAGPRWSIIRDVLHW